MGYHEIGAMDKVSKCQVSKLLATQIKPDVFNKHNSCVLSANDNVAHWHHSNSQHFKSTHEEKSSQAIAKIAIYSSLVQHTVNYRD